MHCSVSQCLEERINDFDLILEERVDHGTDIQSRPDPTQPQGPFFPPVYLLSSIDVS